LTRLSPTPLSTEVPARQDSRPRREALLVIVLVCLTVYNSNCRLIGSGDSFPARLLPFEILTNGTLVFDSLGSPPSGAYWFMYARGGHLLSRYPIVLPVLVTPLFVPAAIYVAAVKPNFWRFETILELMEKGVASLIAALSVAVMWLTLRRLTGRKMALLLAVAYAFGTQTWSTSSQALWQHGMGELLFASTLYLLVRCGSSPSVALAVGALCSLMAFNRPPNALFAAAVAVFYVLRGRKGLPRFALGALALSLPFLVYNLYYFGRPLGGYQSLVGSTFFEHSALDGVAAMLVSPGKGILVFAPFFLFLALGRGLELGAAGRLPVLLLWLAFLGQLVLYGATDWRAGWCYGPRFLTDALPFLIVALVPAVEVLRPAALALFCGFVAFAIFVQAIGAFCFPAGGSYLLSQADFWKPSNSQFLVELRGGLARPEFAPRIARWLRRTIRGRPATVVSPSTSFYTVTPCRAADTRVLGPFGGPPLRAGSDRFFRLAGHCGVPPTAKAVAVNLTVFGAEAPGELRLLSGPGVEAAAFGISYGAGQTRANNAILPLDAGGSLGLSCEQNSGVVHVLLDVSGYFE
jgi:hypothetical protein